MIAESSVPLSGCYFNDIAMNQYSGNSGNVGGKSRKDIVDELLAFTWSDTKHMVTEYDSGMRAREHEVKQPFKPVKMEDVQYSNRYRTFPNSDLLDLNTLVSDRAKEGEQGFHASDLRIPEYELGVISEESSALSMSRHSSGSHPLPTHMSSSSNSSETEYRMPVSNNVRVSTLTDQKSLAQFPEFPALQARVKSEQTPISPASNSEQKPVRTKRRFIRRRSSERKPFENVPDFVKDELNTTSGIGHFTMSELMCCLLFAHREALSSNSYANIRAKMGNKRSRVSIRRKIEKIVLSETGLSGGLLGLTCDQNQLVLEAIWNRLMNLISDAETYGTQNLKLFASQLREYAQNPLKFAMRSS